jgi:hypothetical protein
MFVLCDKNKETSQDNQDKKKVPKKYKERKIREGRQIKKYEESVFRVGYGLDDPGFKYRQGQEVFCRLKIVHTDP